MTRVSVEGLSLTYPGAPAPALDRLDLTVESGALAVLLGPSGCGKTTALKVLAGLARADAGEVRLDGRSVSALPPERRGTVMVFQNPLLFPGLTVAQNVAFGLRMRRLPRAETARRVEAMLALVGLADLGPRLPAALSGGQAQRVALARALVIEPQVLLLDEPLTGLDAHLRGDMRSLIRDLQRRLGITTLMVTHDQEEATALADRMGLMLGGRLRQEGPPEALYHRPADAEVARFFGGCNLWPGTATAGQFLGAPGPLQLAEGAASGAGHLTIRPEAVRLGPAAVNALPARVEARQFLGPRTRLRLSARGESVEADCAPDLARDLPPGTATTINLPPGSLWLIPARAG